MTSLRSTLGDVEFAFDFELINTTTYRKALYFTSKKEAESDENFKPEDSQNLKTGTVILSEPDAFPKEDDIIVELVSEGARQHSKPDGHFLTSDVLPINDQGDQTSAVHLFDSVIALPSLAQFHIPEIHKFKIAEIVSALSDEDAPALILPGQPPEKETEDDVLSVVEGVMQEIMTEATDTSSPEVTQYQDDTTTPSFTLLVDVSIPEANGDADIHHSGAFKDLMEINVEPMESNSSTATIPLEDNGTDMVLFAPKPLNLQDYLNYLASTNHNIHFSQSLGLNGLKESVMNSDAENRLLERMALDFERLDRKGAQMVHSSSNGHELSAIANYTLEELIYSSNSSHIIKGQRTDTKEAVRKSFEYPLVPR